MSADDRGLSRHEFDREVLQHLDSLYGYALHLSHSSEDAADLVQDTYARAFRSFRQYTLGTNAKAWLFAILRNTFLNQRRSVRRRPPEIHCDWIDELEAGESVEPDSRGPDPYRKFLNDLLREDISRALAELPEDFRSAVVLCDVEGFSYSEIAEILEVPVGTVRSRIHRGRSRLRSLLEEWYSDGRGK
jgi:RNA polymerase sigma-70 factor (ECF subfamily)